MLTSSFLQSKYFNFCVFRKKITKLKTSLWFKEAFLFANINVILFVYVACSMMMAGPNLNCLLMKDTLYISMVSSDSCSFDRLYPTKTIHEVGCYFRGWFVHARVVKFLRVDQWWYPLCECQRIMKAENGFYQCYECKQTNFIVTFEWSSLWNLIVIMLFVLSLSHYSQFSIHRKVFRCLYPELFHAWNLRGRMSRRKLLVDLFHTWEMPQRIELQALLSVNFCLWSKKLCGREQVKERTSELVVGCFYV